MKGTIYVLLSAVCFSTGGVLIKSIPWSSITIQGIRSIFSFMLIASYMVITKRKFVWNKTVLFGAVCNTAMALTFVSATKMTTAANAIVLQFTEPIFVILLMWALYKKKPKKRQWWHVRSCLPVSYASFRFPERRGNGGKSACGIFGIYLCAGYDDERFSGS